MTSTPEVQEILEDCLRRHPALAACRRAMEAAHELLRSAFQDGKKLLICGNGGSAADSGHIAAELLKNFRRPRPIADERALLLGEDLASGLQGALPAIPLPDLVAIGTAWANDGDPRYGFAQLAWALGNPGDVLWGISTSGHAKNIALAARAAWAKGLKVLGLSGGDGGALKALCDVCICVPERETFRVQELHLPVYHALCAMLECHFFAHS